MKIIQKLILLKENVGGKHMSNDKNKLIDVICNYEEKVADLEQENESLENIKNIYISGNEKIKDVTIIEKLSDSEQQKINNVFSSVEQSANLMGEIAIESYSNEFKTGTQEFENYNEQMSKLFIEISKHTEVAHTIYYRYNVELFGPTAGFWYGFGILCLSERKDKEQLSCQWIEILRIRN